MPLKPHLSIYATLLLGLMLVTSSAGFANPTRSSTDNTKPAMLDLPALATIPLMSQSPALSTIPLMAQSPAVLDIAVNVSAPAVHGQDYVPIKEQVDATQPVNDRTPTRLLIPAIGLDAPVEVVGWHVENRSGRSINVWDVPNHFAAGWFKTSAPFGVVGNTVLDGHHNIYGQVFRNLINLDVGDTMTLYAAGQERIYRVDQKLILPAAGQTIEVLKANARYISPTTDERLTLLTCWPPTGNSHRLIIVALPVLITPPINTSPADSDLPGWAGAPAR